MKQVSIIGFGRFGKTLYRLIKDDFKILLYNKSKIDTKGLNLSKHTFIETNLSNVYKSEAVFFAVPISKFEKVIRDHGKYFTEKNLLIDVLSVKIHPQNVLEKYLKNTNIQALLTHPMFGPDSTKDGFEKHTIILDKFKTDDANYKFWKNYFLNKKIKVIEMSAGQHDKIAANSQGLTHFIGRLLNEYKFQKSDIDSLGAKKLLDIMQQTCNDTWQLFNDLQQYNPYTKQVRVKLGISFDKLYNKLLPKQINPKYITFGIQGGRGSFNEEALFYYIKKSKIQNYRVKYLYTSGNVLSSLHKGEIDRGQFAIHNAVGGVVKESIVAMAKYKFNIVDQFSIKIAHALMIRKDANLKEINSIMSHPQVFAQCGQTLLRKYPDLKQLSGSGDLIDHAMVAKYLSQKKLSKNIATIGSKILAQIYNLRVVEDNLQDAKENYTSFLQISRL
ncbi:MAG: prephenate dehydrogenase/arogenate dehydrogenase family protein [Candidatus Levybacteria bacterium]|nr:prephenate dehydrogenase/arogenate dehydrogenase family protein [Candidatus Levybacteria bacterium]